MAAKPVSARAYGANAPNSAESVNRSDLMEGEEIDPSTRSKQTTTQQLGPYLGLGMQMAGAMAAFGALGWWLDGRWGTEPWLLVVGVVLGGVGGTYSVIRSAIRSSRPVIKDTKVDVPLADGSEVRKQ